MNKTEICTYCKTEIEWEGSHENKGVIWQCDSLNCNHFFCSKCYEDKFKESASQDSEEHVLCLDCREHLREIFDKEIVIDNIGTCLSLKNREDAVDIIFNIYQHGSEDMWSILGDLQLRGFSLEDTYHIYAECMKRSDSDTIVRITEPLEELPVEVREYVEKHEAEIAGLQ